MVIWNLQKKLILSLIFRCDNKSFVIQNVFLAMTNNVKKRKTTDYCCKSRHPGCFQRPPHCLMIKMKILWLAWQNLKAGVLLTFQKVQLQNLKSFKIQFNLVFVCLCMHRNPTHYYFPGSCYCWIDVLNQYQQKYLETIIQVISWKTKVLSTYQILQRHCVGEPSQKFLLDLNLRETVLRLDFSIYLPI